MPLTVNAVGGYNSYQILELFEESYDPSQPVIVFDAGTNDNPSYPADPGRKPRQGGGDGGQPLHGRADDPRPPPGGVDDSGKNRVVAEFAASRPGTQTPDWAGFVAQPPGADAGRQPAPDRSRAPKLRARLIAQGVMALPAEERRRRRLQRAVARPALAQAPAHIPQSHEMERREAEISRAIGIELLRQTAASTLAALL